MSNGDIFAGEVIGTAVLILFGAGVCAAVTLHHSRAKTSGWIVISFGWAWPCWPGRTPPPRCPAGTSTPL
ncbi:hypothetical protein GCM10010446_05620 [Streptomyces enissocaesilis]|uniref:Glycerol uptake facilitator protein n=1 Tax=Streptomyces enissocaesilis TaxID=332589 RepID=A0ABN3WRG7_9ACTN